MADNAEGEPVEVQPVAINYEKLKKRRPTRNKASNFLEIYANSMNMEASFHDFKLFFGETTVATQEELVIEEKIAVVMSPEHALACLKALKGAIENYVAAFGPIREQK
ncbi:MAG TPA: DUF3467 domain-containing protein [Pyrinomonadaceae bacterium]|nr:DUF3467 domain-containing protein [Pyrinomonadaceae bacterium]